MLLTLKVENIWQRCEYRIGLLIKGVNIPLAIQRWGHTLQFNGWNVTFQQKIGTHLWPPQLSLSHMILSILLL